MIKSRLAGRRGNKGSLAAAAFCRRGERERVQVLKYIDLKQDWRAAEYDGVKGTLPNWVPKQPRDHFEAVQDELCHGIASGELSYKDVIEKVRRYAFGSAIWRFFAGRSHETHLFFLGDLLRATKVAERDSKEAGLSDLLGPKLAGDANTGSKVKTSAALAHAKVHGTPEEKAIRRKHYQQEVDSLHRKNPHLSRNRINEIAAAKFQVSPKTISRNTTSPK